MGDGCIGADAVDKRDGQPGRQAAAGGNDGGLSMDFTPQQRKFLLAASRAAPVNQEFDYRVVAAGSGLSEAEADEINTIFKRAGFFDGLRLKSKLTAQGRRIAKQLESEPAQEGESDELEIGEDGERLLMLIHRSVKRDAKQVAQSWLLGQKL